MKTRTQLWTGITACLGLLVLILDAKTALSGAREGVELCLYTVLPSLFPFFILSVLINRSFTGRKIKILRPIGIACGIPEGAESLLLLGFLGGYPVGAQSIREAYEGKSLNRHDAHRMLGFCSNAGPAFIFGIAGSLFERKAIPWILWGIHIISALLVGLILPHKTKHLVKMSQASPVTIPQAVERSMKTIAVVCSWVIVFRVVLTFCQRWFLWLLPQQIQIGLVGLLELSNGFIELHSVTSQGVRFIISAGILSFGGICVALQTVSITRELGTGMYFPGKILQAGISILIAAILQRLLFSSSDQSSIPVICYAIIAAMIGSFLFCLYHKKKVVALPC